MPRVMDYEKYMKSFLFCGKNSDKSNIDLGAVEPKPEEDNDVNAYLLNREKKEMSEKGDGNHNNDKCGSGEGIIITLHIPSMVCLDLAAAFCQGTPYARDEVMVVAKEPRSGLNPQFYRFENSNSKGKHLKNDLIREANNNNKAREEGCGEVEKTWARKRKERIGEEGREGVGGREQRLAHT